MKKYNKKFVLLFLLSIFAFNCKTQDSFEKNLKECKIFKSYIIRDSSYIINLDQNIYDEEKKTYRNIGSFQIKKIGDRLFFHNINFLFTTYFNVEITKQLELELRKKAIEEVVNYLEEYNIEIGSFIHIKIIREQK
jgi:hypothetical protein